jgi:hypothetical protein
MADVNSARWRRNAPASGMGAALAGARSANAQHPRHRASMSSMPGINDMQAFLAELRTVKLRKVHSRQDKGKGRADGGLKGVLGAFTDSALSGWSRDIVNRDGPGSQVRQCPNARASRYALR